MRRFTLIAAAALSLVALISACATSPNEGLGAAADDTKPAQTDPDAGSTKLPPKTAAAGDGGTTDAATTPGTGSSTSSGGSSGSSTSSSGSSGSSGSTSSSSSSSSSSGSSGAAGPSCDMSDPVKLFIYQLEVSNQSSPVACPCPSTECCYLGVTCIAP